MLIGNKMTKSTLGDLVAAEMSKIVDSEEHVNMFSKVAKKKEDKSEDTKDKKDKKDKKSEKPEKSGKPNPFVKKDKKDKKDKEDDKEPKKKDKKSEKSDKKEKGKKEDKKDDKKKEMTSESMSSFVNLLTKASDTLDNYGLHKSAALTLQALDTLIGEVAMDKFAHGPEDVEGTEGLEAFEGDLELSRFMNLGGGEGGEGEITDPLLKAELEGLDTGEPTKVFDDLEDADDTSVLDELGLSEGGEEDVERTDLGEPLPTLAAFMEDEDSRKVFSKLDAWMVRHAYEGYGHTDGDLMAADDDEEDLAPEDRDPGFTYESDPHDPSDVVRLPKAMVSSKDLPGLPGPGRSGAFNKYWNKEPIPGHVLDMPSARTVKHHKDDLFEVEPEWRRYTDLTPEERLEHDMGAGLNERVDIDPDQLTDEDVSTTYVEPPEDIDEDLAFHGPTGTYEDEYDVNDHREGPPHDEDAEFAEALRHAMTTDPDGNIDEYFEDIDMPNLRNALENPYDADDEGADFEDEE